MDRSHEPDERAKWRVGATALVVGGVLLLGAAAGAMTLARAALLRREASAAAATERAATPQEPASRLGWLLRRVGYWSLLAVAAAASWLANVVRPHDTRD